MSKISIPFILQNLIEDVDCLLKSLKPTSISSISKFLKQFPRNILNAKLEELEFEHPNVENPSFSIRFKKKNKTSEIKLTNQLLSPFRITITDHTQFTDKLLDYNSSHELLKTTLSGLIEEKVKNTISININHLQEQASNLPANENNQIEISIFFNLLKILIISEISSNNVASLTAESFLTSVTHLTNKFAPDIKTIILAVKDNINLPENIEKAVFSYAKLLAKVAIFSSSSQISKTVINYLDSIINSQSDKIANDYSFFKTCYLGEPGFRSIFGDDNNVYTLIQICREKLNDFEKKYVEFTLLIKELADHSDNVPEVIELAAVLNEQMNIYSQSLLDISLKRKDIDKLEINPFEDFKLRIRNEIESFRKNNILSLDQLGILDKILNALAKLIPSFIIPKKSRISFFQERTQNKQLNVLLDKIQNKPICKY
jgi:hypothetical protein